MDDQELLDALMFHQSLIKCPMCDGRGYWWDVHMSCETTCSWCADRRGSFYELKKAMNE